MITCAGCGGPPGARIAAEPEPGPHRRSDPLGPYRALGYIVGPARFPAVGRFTFFPGPADSLYALLAISIPNNALRFRADGPAYLARYQVDLRILDPIHSTPVVVVHETQEVRVHSFRETSRDDESVIFQGLFRLAPGSYEVELSLRDLASSRGLDLRTAIRAPESHWHSTTTPLLVYRAEPRSDPSMPPRLIARPRGTLEFHGSEGSIYVESWPEAGDTLLELQALQEGELVWSQTIPIDPGGLRSHLVAIDPGQLPPGRLELRARVSGRPAALAPLLVALTRDWVISEYRDAVSYLRPAADPIELERLETGPVPERAERLRAFWERRDPVPATPENEYFEGYFRRLREANDRFREPTRPGWLTDRGEVYAVLGPPDEVFRQLDPEAGAAHTQVWRYSESLGFDVRLVFIDEGGAGIFRLTAESRQTFRKALRDLHH